MILRNLELVLKTLLKYEFFEQSKNNIIQEQRNQIRKKTLENGE
jgi:hypothetical protein